ncbi:4'-phosphopantetheinyl transferase superfamily protein [Ekhidna sp.]|jgi:4'-phosphopantetheinyl transferase|uniref:4'-phosphopantetheinyl transferase family protein n=1 Tax=Ekhidna sp. TaxID=2608089 RepID=UPI0032ED7E16
MGTVSGHSENTDLKKSNEILILYSHINQHLSDSSWNKAMEQLPNYMQTGVQALHHWQDRHASLVGKLLLKRALKMFGYPENVLNDIRYSQNGKPYIDSSLDFNLSHTRKHVLCAIGRGLCLGIDIEEIRSMNLEAFKSSFNGNAWDYINNSSNPMRTFFKYWTILESVIKADGRGLEISLPEIGITGSRAFLESKTWYLNSFSKIDNNWISVSSNKKIDKIDWLEIVLPF